MTMYALARRWDRHRAAVVLGLKLCGAAFVVFFFAVMGSSLSYQMYIVFLFVLMAAIAWRPKTSLVVAALITCFGAFVRRILAEDGRIDADPLVLLPVLLAVVALLYADKKYDGPRDIWQRLVYVTVGVFVLANFAHKLFAVPSLFTLIVQCSMLLIVVQVRGGRLPDVWDTVERLLPIIGTVVAAYGIAQFFLLFEWDRLWMLSSKLNSIGQPFVQQLRVFGTAESPASFSAVLSAALLAAIARIRATKNLATQVFLLSGMGAMAFALVLTGVRSALLGLAAALAWMAISGRGGVSRVVPVGIAVAAGYLVVTVVGRFGDDSSILNANRLTEFDASTDGSAQTRLKLLQLAPEAMLYPLGKGGIAGGGTVNLDNMFVDVLFKAGPFVAIAVVALFVKVMIDALSIRLDPSATGASSVAVFFVVFSLSLNPFATANGLIGALAFGSVMRTAWLARRKKSDQQRTMKNLTAVEVPT
ncbi:MULTISPECIES: hypothetical protein [Rhodococcus]|uniref:Uncharacterized protein n=1 Tax=Rhodococcus cerastii TaxID=908616 RepID=A0ABU4D3Y5_9NOCA|nr:MULTISPECIES: hypothetical protein [Rhodococcus]MDV6304417.1 hypothetical protein [Rhodococcus cerastii]MDV7991247.1 hypothetical protein [Rhodococcus sp. IEGM 1374]MDV8077534.1 hypothetical protein [Rhodococcus sp. IEGM 1370]